MYEENEREKKRDKKIFKILKRSSITIGAGLGFLILIPFLPDVSDAEKQKNILDLFFMTGWCIAGYGAFMSLCVFFLRSKVLLIDGLMNFFVVPSYAIWFAFEAFKILG